MPVFTVNGIPDSTDRVLLDSLIGLIQRAAAKPLALQPGDVSVFFPTDLVQMGLGEELVCLVDGLFVKPERTTEVRQRVFDAVKDVLRGFAERHLSKCKKVEVIPSCFDQNRDGFAVWERQK